jgi:hypothetical protein
MGGYNGWRQILHGDHLGNYFTVGVITASKFAGDGSELTNLPSTDSIWRSNTTGIHTLTNVGLGTTNTEGYQLKVVGNLKLAGRLDGTATGNILPHLWTNFNDLPAAGINHGAFAHVHEFNKAYFAHNIGTTINVAVSTDTVGGQATGVFYFNGVERPGSFPISRGATYIFNQDDASNVNYNSQEHPLMFSTSQDGELAGGDHYMMGVTYKLDGVQVTMAGYVSGFSSATTRRIEWTPVAAAPNTLWYWCHYHTGQGNSLSMNNNGWFELVNKDLDGTVGTGTENYRVGVVTATSFSGDGSGLTNIAVSYAASSGIATLAQGLVDKPDILVANINCTGIVTGATFVGDGSGLTGITASGSGIVIREGGTLVGTIGTVNFGTGFSVSPASAGVVTVTTSGGGGGGSGISGMVYQEEGSTVGTAQTVNFIGAACTVTHSGGVATVNLAGAVPFTGAAATITGLDISQYEQAYSWGNHASAGYITNINGSNLGDLSNVSSATPSTNHVLTWSGSQWVPAAAQGGGGSGGGVIIKEEGTNVATGVTSINFVGTGVTATASGTDATITISAIGGSGGVSTTGFGTYTASAGVEQQIDSFPVASYSGAEYTFMIGLGTFRQSQKVLVMHDGSTAFSQEYGIMFSPEQQVSIAATISSGNVLVKFTPEAGISGLSTYRYVKTLIQGI